MAISADEIFRTTALNRDESQQVVDAIDGDWRLERFAWALIKVRVYSVAEIVDRIRALKVMLK